MYQMAYNVFCWDYNIFSYLRRKLKLLLEKANYEKRARKDEKIFFGLATGNGTMYLKIESNLPSPRNIYGERGHFAN